MLFENLAKKSHFFFKIKTANVIKTKLRLFWIVFTRCTFLDDFQQPWFLSLTSEGMKAELQKYYTSNSSSCWASEKTRRAEQSKIRLRFGSTFYQDCDNPPSSTTRVPSRLSKSLLLGCFLNSFFRGPFCITLQYNTTSYRHPPRSSKSIRDPIIIISLRSMFAFHFFLFSFLDLEGVF